MTWQRSKTNCNLFDPEALWRAPRSSCLSKTLLIMSARSTHIVCYEVIVWFSQEETRLMCQGTLSRIAFFFATSLWGMAAILQRDDASPLVACGCLGFVAVVLVAIIALHIALLIWVMRDAKNRGMENAVVWMIVVILTGIIGLIIYLFTRPQGNLAPCRHCGNTRLGVSAKCPHCGNS
jgi:hypothetical protein